MSADQDALPTDLDQPGCSSAGSGAGVPEAKRRKTEQLITHDAFQTAAGEETGRREIRLAVVGCSHGEMDSIYETLAKLDEERGVKTDLLICCGDFQAVRNYGDLHHMNVKDHHKKLMTFYKYYKGEETAPVLTLFVGGNHESSGYLAELPYGGWVAPNIYYMGYASVVQFGGLRIGGWSGIYKPDDYNLGHFEAPPFRGSRRFSSLISAYHVRSTECFRLKQLAADNAPKLDMMVTHDWPAGVTKFGNEQQLRRWKPYFCQDLDRNQLGNPASMELLYELKPTHWFSAHLHVRFTAEVEHFAPDGNLSSTTKFLALDKPLLDKPAGRRHLAFIELIDIPIADVVEEEALELRYDPTWLAILKNTDFLTEVSEKPVYMPSKYSSGERSNFQPTAEELDEVERLFRNDFRIPTDFRHTAPIETNPRNYKGRANLQGIDASLYYRNPQSTEFCEKLGIRDLNSVLCQVVRDNVGVPYYVSSQQRGEEQAQEGCTAPTDSKNPEEIDLDDDGGDDEGNTKFGDQDFIIDVEGASNGK